VNFSPEPPFRRLGAAVSSSVRRYSADVSTTRRHSRRSARPPSTGLSSTTRRGRLLAQTSAVHPLLRAAAERQAGIFSAADARRAGYAHPEIRQLCASGRWQRLRRGIYVAADELARAEEKGRRHQLDCLAVLLAVDRPSAAISHRSAARLWGFPQLRRPADLVRLTDPAHGHAGRGFHVTRAPLDPHEVRTSGPFRLTSAARTLIDIAREEPLEDAVAAMDGGLLAGRVAAADLRTAAERVRSWRGGPRAVRAASLADGRAASPLETRGRLRIVGAGLPTPELQVEIRTGGRLVAVVDAWFEEAAVAVEFDGRIKYTDPWRDRSPEQVLWEEKRREDELRSLDIRVVRVVDAELSPALWPTVEGRLRELLAVPGPAGRRFTSTPRSAGLRRTG
jgi:Transcriptional regulator, AbiEi antitoxin